MKNRFRIATISYIIILGVLLGAGLFAGIVVAPTTFHTELWLGGEVLSHYQEGLIMTQNFLKLSYLVIFGVIVIFLYEGYKYKKFERDRLLKLQHFLLLPQVCYLANIICLIL